MRPLQHLDALDVEQLHAQLLLAVLRHAVDDDGHRRIGIVDLRDAADRHEAVADGEGFVVGDVRRHRQNVPRAADTAGLELRGSERTHGDRDVLQILGATLRRDRDLFQRLPASDAMLRVRALRPGHADVATRKMAAKCRDGMFVVSC